MTAAPCRYQVIVKDAQGLVFETITRRYLKDARRVFTQLAHHYADRPTSIGLVGVDAQWEECELFAALMLPNPVAYLQAREAAS
jgi:hypothetical protein